MSSLLYDHLRSSPIFNNLDAFMFQIVEERLQFKELTSDEILFHEGEHGDYLAFVLLGGLDILKKSVNTDNQEQFIKVGHISCGDSVGEMAIIDTLSRSATVRATSLTALVTLSKNDFEQILNDYPRVGIEILRGMSMLLSLKLRRASENMSNNK